MEEKQVSLADGRRIGFADLGCRSGFPVFYFHGFPGSRLEAGLLGIPDLPGLRIIAVDRPGIGLSDFLPNRSLQDWPKDVEAVADLLGIGRFGVLGISGGGPYAAVCAWALPGRVVAAGFVCAPGEIESNARNLPLHARDRMLFKLWEYFPGFRNPSYASFAFFLRHWPLMFIDARMRMLPRCDQEVLSQPAFRRTLADSFRESVRQGAAGGTQEMKILFSSWPFHPSQIQVPVALWHGELDVIVPAAMGRQLAQQIPHCQARFYQEESHYSLLAVRSAEILKDFENAIQNATGYGSS